jgi:hypothetical protein
MKLYVVRKWHGRWAVFSGQTMISDFESYEEAVVTAARAADVLSESLPLSSRVSANPLPMQPCATTKAT